MQWTAEQKRVIDLRGCNILVSAAAGSGKTAVLVQRIISLITEGESPIDIDRLLIVTFTNAAAAEMRERIGAAIEKKLNEIPDNLHLQKQTTLVHSAQITTIHSFCLNVIRNHFNTIDLDPSFRIADEAELTLIKSDVLGDLLESYYEEGNDDFLEFIEKFASGKTDAAIEDIVLKLYQFSMSYPWPEEWLDEKKNAYGVSSMNEMKESDWMKALLTLLETISSDLVQRCKEAVALCEEADGPRAYIPALRSDEALLIELSGLKDYEEYANALSGFSFARLSGKKEEGVSEDKKNQVKVIRDEVKKALNDLIKNYFSQSAEEMLEDIKFMQKPMEVLVKLCKDFKSAYEKKKADKNIVDFNDLEHYALKILVKKDNGILLPTAAADELSEHFAEIMIDEYQDSNLVQETILQSISGERFHKPNLFMVGDVKQSIYKFRLARPEIFMEKYDTYDLEEGSCQRIDLHKNFRSREVVLDSINYIFEQIMTKKLGGILYDEQAALYPGADFGEETNGISTDTEILLVEVEPKETETESSSKRKEEQRLSTDEEESEYTARELEAKAIAKRMKELTDPENGLKIFDKKENKYRIAGFRDMVILLRTMSGWAEVFADTLAAEGISAHTDTQSGYFSTLEIRTVLNLLRIIDNPRQDIPFTSILRSPIVNLSSDELSLIKLPRRKLLMYEAAFEYMEDNADELSDKIREFLFKLTQYRNLVYHLSIHELIIKVLDDTGYYDYAATMPAGEKRKANLDMLIQRAIQFEGTSYSGLFHFIRYIEKLHKYDIDFGEAKITGEQETAVKIMSIHKSKGLEFPIVFVGGMGKSFNNQDSRSRLLIHPDLGIGTDYINHELRIKTPTLIKKVIQKELVLENLGEELRVLYVALTRAKEKLILIGAVKNLEKSITKVGSICRQKEKALLYYQLSTAATYFDWIIPALLRYPAMEETLSSFGIRQDNLNPLYQSSANMNIRKFFYEDLAFTEYLEQFEKNVNQEELSHWDASTIYDEDIREEIARKMVFEYPYQNEITINTKLTVSELKRLSQQEEFDYVIPLMNITVKEKEFPVPSFIKEPDIAEGSYLGTLYHSVLENMDLNKINSQDELESYLSGLLSAGKVSLADLTALDIDRLYLFVKSPLAQRMRNASGKNKLFKERQFVMGLKACDINSNLKSEELVLVQGIIDAYFEEEGELVLLDYKTDAVTGQNAEELLVKRYHVQLEYYKRALEQLTGKKVKEKIIYSFGLNKEIET